jgi:predicted DCC family thiol-disulfide oxidoreductase YuxK
MQTVILYDGLCAFCNQSVRIIKYLDWGKAFTYTDLQDWSNVHERYPMLDRVAVAGAIHVIRLDGKIYAGYEGARQIVRHLPLFFWLYPLLYLPGITWLGPKVYRWIALRRYQFNRIFGGPPLCDDSTCKIH